MNIELEQRLPDEAAKWYGKFPLRYHEGVYLGRDLATTEQDPVPAFLIGFTTFFLLREYGRIMNSPIATGAALTLLVLTPFFTKKLILDPRNNQKNNF